MKGFVTPFYMLQGACGSNGDKLFFCHDYFKHECWESDDLSTWTFHSKPTKTRKQPNVAATKGC